MADRIDGTIWQANAGKTVLEWGRREPVPGNCLKFSRIREVDAAFDISKIQICLPTLGTETYFKAGQYIEVKTGEYFVLNRGQEARAAIRRPTPVEGFCIFLTEETLAEVYAAANTSTDRLLDMPDSKPRQHFEFLEKNFSLRENVLGACLQNLKQQLCMPGKDKLMDWDRFYFNLAESLLDTKKLINHQLETIPAAKFATRQEIFRRISQARNYILEQYAQPLPLEEIARVAHFSAYHTARLYHAVYGITPHQHILQLRIQRAMELLRQNISPTEAAYLLSFSDRRAFAKVFKKITGVSPAHFQQSSPSSPVPMRIFRA